MKSAIPLSSSKKKKKKKNDSVPTPESEIENRILPTETTSSSSPRITDAPSNTTPTEPEKTVPRVQSTDAFFLGKGDFLKVGEEPFQPDPDDPSIRPFRSGFELDKKSFEQKDLAVNEPDGVSLAGEIDPNGRKTPEQLTSLQKQKSSILPSILNCSGVVQDACNAIVDDSFNRCFQMKDQRPWNFNFYLYPIWVVGFVIRHCVLLPLRFTWLVLSLVMFFLLFFIVHYTMPEKKAQVVKRKLLEYLAAAFVMSWTGVIKYHGPKPTRRGGCVYVSNHTSMIDYHVVAQVSLFACIMQKHPGWVGFIQNTALKAVDCITFNRTDIKDKQAVSRRLKEHVRDPTKLPLLIFPEGTCVNNEHCVMFKRGAFDLGVPVCPIAIKYDKTFVDAFWNSRKQSFSAHLIKLMSSWSVVADVWFMEPQTIRENETSIEFAERVRAMIAKKAGLKMVAWDGMLKYYRPHPRERIARQKIFGERFQTILSSLGFYHHSHSSREMSQSE